MKIAAQPFQLHLAIRFSSSSHFLCNTDIVSLHILLIPCLLASFLHSVQYANSAGNFHNSADFPRKVAHNLYISKQSLFPSIRHFKIPSCFNNHSFSINHPHTQQVFRSSLLHDDTERLLKSDYDYLLLLLLVQLSYFRPSRQYLNMKHLRHKESYRAHPIRF